MPSFRAAAVRVRAPATSANLGPGFDSAGLALSLYDDVLVRVTDSGLTVDVAGEGADEVPRDERHLVVASLRAAFDRLGGQPRGLEVVCANRIPHARGLGSSSAAIVSAVLAARALVVGGSSAMDDDACLDLATDLEGHPDNVAACLLGGVTFAWTGDGRARAIRLEAHAGLAPVVFVPSDQSSTAEVRGLLPASVPYADAVLNASRAALLPYALTVDPSLLLPATEDRLHQSYRAPAMRATADLVQRLRGEGVPAVVSGAGPTVLALTTAPARAALVEVGCSGWRVLPLDVAVRGAHLMIAP